MPARGVVPRLTDPLEASPSRSRAWDVHDDEDLVVVDKPVGVAVHPASGGPAPRWSGTRRRRAIASRPRAPPSARASCTAWTWARRRDGDRQERARLHAAQDAFRDRTVDKTYHALVQGQPDPLEGTIDAPIGRHPQPDYGSPSRDGKPSVTHYAILEAYRFASLVEVHLETGRTHQIRVHFAALKHPCVGDLTYGADPMLAKRVGLERQWLHAVPLGSSTRDRGIRRVPVVVPTGPGPRTRGHP